MKIINKSFKEWKKSELEKYVGLIYQDNFALLETWLTTDSIITEQETAFLTTLCEEAKIAINYWNEQELRQRFITPITWLVKFHDYKQNINFFAERKLSKVIKNEIVEITLHGTVDWLLASGVQDPEHPFFFIHEYKKEKGVDNDPLGQLLATMVAAKALNQEPPEPTLFNPAPKHFYKDIPIYGAYVSGRNWFFLVLEDNKYSISQPFVATKMEDLQAIFKTLKAQKQLIYSYLEEK